MEKENLFTIVTIAYNAENEIEQTMESVLAQDYRPIQYIIVDGGSHDKTMEIVRAYIDIFANAGISFSYISEPDNGISDAFNKGIGKAEGTVIGLLNSGDMYVKGIIRYIMDNLKNEMEVICGDIIWSDYSRDVKYVRKSSLNWKKLRKKNTIMHPACFIKKTAYTKYGLYDCNYKYAMDYELLARMYRNGAKFQYLEKTVAIMKAGGASDNGKREMYEEIKEVIVQNGYLKMEANLIVSFHKYKNIMIKTIKGNAFLKELFVKYKNSGEKW